MSDASPCPRRDGRGGAIVIFVLAALAIAVIVWRRSQPASDAALPARRTLHLASVGPGVARLTLDGRDLGEATRDPTDGAIRGPAILQVEVNASSLSFSEVEITRDAAVPVEIARGIQTVLAMSGALRTRIVEPAPATPPR